MVTRLPKPSETRLGSNPRKVWQPELVREFDDFIDKQEGIGSHVLYIRVIKETTHRCWQTTSQQATGLCPECYGTGHVISIERHLMRDYAESAPGREAQALEGTEPGKMYNPMESFAAKPILRPKQGDRIITIDWNPATRRPENVLGVFQVERVHAMREEQGILVFWKLYCQAWSVNFEAIETLVRRETRIRIID